MAMYSSRLCFLPAITFEDILNSRNSPFQGVRPTVSSANPQSHRTFECCDHTMAPHAQVKKRTHLGKEHNGFGPIFVNRGNKATYMSWLCLLGYVCILCLWLYKRGERTKPNSWFFDLISLLLLIGSAILGEFIRRACLFYEEYGHINKRYIGSTKEAAAACFYQGNIYLVIVVGALCLGFAFILWMVEPNVIDSKHLQIILTGMIFTPLVSFLLDLRSPTAAEKSQLNEAESNNVADGLAWSYYFGYLKLVLPKLDETINGTELQIDGSWFRDIVADNPKTTRLFIVLPKNCYCYDSFDKVDKRIIRIDSTKPLEIDRAGVARRVYKNTIYKVSAQRQTFHCLMEYATPLQSLYDMYMLLGKSDMPSFDKKQLDLQVVQFVKKLKNILEGDPLCRGKYCLVTIGDAHDKLADVIVDEIMSETVSLD